MSAQQRFSRTNLSRTYNRERRTRSRSPSFSQSWRRRRSLSRSGSPRRGHSGESSRREWRYDSPPRELGVSPGRVNDHVIEGVVVPGGLGFISSEIAAGDYDVEGVSGVLSRPAGHVEEDLDSTYAVLLQRLSLSPAQRASTQELLLMNLPSERADLANELLDYLNAQMLSAGLATRSGSAKLAEKEGTPPFTRVWVAANAPFGFVRTRTHQDGTLALRLSGIAVFRGKPLNICRVRNFPTQHAAMLSGAAPTASGVDSGSPAFAASAESNPAAAMAAARAAAANLGTGPAGFCTPSYAPSATGRMERVALVDLPGTAELPEEEMKRLLASQGVLLMSQYFPDALVRAEGRRESFCIFQYERAESLANLKQTLQQRKHPDPARIPRFTTPEALLKDPEYSKAMKEALLRSAQGQRLMRCQCPTRVLMLSNMATAEELMDASTYIEIKDDIRIECNNFGPVLSVELPRPLAASSKTAAPSAAGGGDPAPGGIAATAAHGAAATNATGATGADDSTPAIGGKGDAHESMDPSAARVAGQSATAGGENSNPSTAETSARAAAAAAPSTGEVTGKIDQSDTGPEGGAADAASFRRVPRTDDTPVGFAFVEFDSVVTAGIARKSLTGRRFGGKEVEANYFSEVRYIKQDFSRPEPNYSEEESSVHNANLRPSEARLAKATAARGRLIATGLLQIADGSPASASRAALMGIETVPAQTAQAAPAAPAAVAAGALAAAWPPPVVGAPPPAAALPPAPAMQNA